MAGARTKGEKRRQKKNRPKNEIVLREPNGRASRKGTQYAIPKERQESAKRVVLSARARLLGKDQSRMSLDAVDRPWLGCNAGCFISDEPDVADLWQAIKDIRKIRANYLRAISAPDEHAKGAMLAVLPEPAEVRPDDAPADLRTETEKADAAIAAWEKIMGTLRVKDPLLIRYVNLVVVQDQDIPGPLAQVVRMLQDAGCVK